MLYYGTMGRGADTINVRKRIAAKLRPHKFRRQQREAFVEKTYQDLLAHLISVNAPEREIQKVQEWHNTMKIQVERGKDKSIPDDGRPPLEQINDYCLQRQDIRSSPSEYTFDLSAEEVSPYLILISEDADSTTFPEKIANVRLLLSRVGEIEPFSKR